MAGAARGEQALAGTKIKQAGTVCRTPESNERAELEPVKTEFIEEESNEGAGELKTVK